MILMRGVDNPVAELGWLADRPAAEADVGYDAAGWQSSIWILHAMYENPSVNTVVTHDEHRQSRIRAGLEQPLIIGDVNLDETTIVTGAPLGFVTRPGSPWRRLQWSEYAERLGRPLIPGESVPPCDYWFPRGSWPISINPPPEGSLDEVSFDALIRVLADQTPQHADTPCFAFYASLPSGEFDHPTLLTGPLGAVYDLVRGDDAFRSTPSNFWPHDRSWFVWTDWDLSGTKVSGSPALIQALRSERDLETITWPPD